MKTELKTALENLIISIGAADTWLRHTEEFDAALKALNWTMDWVELCVKDKKGTNRLPSWRG